MDENFEVPSALAPRRDVYSVSRLNREVRALLDRGFALLWIEGELSNLSRPSSGHWYFSLKDRDSQVRCAMFRMRNQFIGFTPADGMQVLARARATLYEPRGDYQLVVEHMEEAGDGLLRRAFEALKKRLAAEGLFDPAHKKPLPPLPCRIGVITSLAKRLDQSHPGRRPRDQGQRLDELDQRLQRSWRAQLRHAGACLAELNARLHQHNPRRRRQHYLLRREHLARCRSQLMKARLQQHRQRLAVLSRG